MSKFTPRRPRRSARMAMAAASVGVAALAAGPIAASATPGDNAGDDAVISTSVDTTACDLTVSSTKDLSNIIVEYADGTEEKFDGLSGTSYVIDADATNEVVKIWVKSGNNKAADGVERPTYYDSEGVGEFHTVDMNCTDVSGGGDTGGNTGGDTGGNTGGDTGGNTGGETGGNTGGTGGTGGTDNGGVMGESMNRGGTTNAPQVMGRTQTPRVMAATAVQSGARYTG